MNTVVDAASKMEKIKAIVAILLCLFILDNACEGIVQAFYHEKSVNLPLIAKEGFLTVFGSGTCPL